MHHKRLDTLIKQLALASIMSLPREFQRISSILVLYYDGSYGDLMLDVPEECCNALPCEISCLFHDNSRFWLMLIVLQHALRRREHI